MGLLERFDQASLIGNVPSFQAVDQRPIEVIAFPAIGHIHAALSLDAILTGPLGDGGQNLSRDRFDSHAGIGQVDSQTLGLISSHPLFDLVDGKRNDVE